jgi:nucleotide-binding universal stress UspA family protein
VNDLDAPLRTIVVGVDGSKASDRAMAWSAARAAESHAVLVAVHVLTYDTELRRDLSLDTITNWRRTLERRMRSEWIEAARAAGVPVRCVVVEAATASEGLLMVAAREAANLVVLGAHGHGGLTDRLLGATTYKVTHRAHVPVVVVPAA